MGKLVIKFKDIMECFVLTDEHDIEHFYQHNTYQGSYLKHKFNLNLFEESKRYRVESKFQCTEIINITP